jgi:hypothetical protein
VTFKAIKAEKIVALYIDLAKMRNTVLGENRLKSCTWNRNLMVRRILPRSVRSIE